MRTDVHSPKNLVPTDYALSGFYMESAPERDSLGGEILEQRIEDVQYTNDDASPRPVYHAEKPVTVKGGNFDRKHTCDHCGAHCRYFAIFTHTPTGDLIATGLDCAMNSFPDYALEGARKVMVMAAKREATKKCRAENLAAWVEANPQHAWVTESDVSIFQSFTGWIKAGSTLSDKQIAVIERATAKRAAKSEPVVPGWVGDVKEHGKRSTICGMIAGTKLIESGYGYHATTVLKLMVTIGDGRKVWVSCPAGLAGKVDRGDGIQFDAALEWKEADFAIAKRPTKPSILFSKVAA